MSCTACTIEQLHDRLTTTEKLFVQWIGVMTFSPLSADVEKAKKAMTKEFNACQERLEKWECTHGHRGA